MYVYKGEEYNEKNLLKLYGLLLYEGKTALDYESFCKNALHNYEFLTSRGIIFTDATPLKSYEFEVNVTFNARVGGIDYNNAYERLKPQLEAAFESLQFKINCGYHMKVTGDYSITTTKNKS